MRKNLSKKTLSAFLAIVMTLATMAGMFTFSAGAAATAPTTLPDGNGVITDSIVVDSSEKAASVTINGTAGKPNNAKVEYKTFTDEINNNWYKAAGVLFYLDASQATFTSQCYLRFTIETAKGNYYTDKDTIDDGKKVGIFSTDAKLSTYDKNISHGTTYCYLMADNASAWTTKSCTGNNLALGKAFSGYVYVPLKDLLYYGYGGAGVTNYQEGVCSFADGVEILEKIEGQLDLTRILIYHSNYGVSGTNDESCTSVSNFQFVYDDNFIDEASVTLTDDLSYNIYANVPAACTDAKVTFAMNGNNTEVVGVKQDDGRYKYTLDGILPQFTGDDITATFSAKVGEKNVTDTYTTTLRDYCDAVLANTNTTENTAILVKSLLHYGAEVQKYAGYNTSELCNDGIDAVENVTITPNAHKNNDEAVWLALGARLNGTITLKVKLAMPEGATKVTYTIGENATAEATVVDGYALIPIMAYQFAEDITVQCVNAEGTAVGGTLVVSFNAYLSMIDAENATDLAKAMINYGRAAELVKKN